jgi:hypothetical protein
MSTHPIGPLSLEPLLVDRLKTALASHLPDVHVLAAADLDGVLEERQLVPAVHVVFAGLKPVTADVASTRVECIWLTVVALKNVCAAGKGAAGRSSTSALANAVYGALAAWMPPGHSKPLALAIGPNGGHSNGFFYLPLAWRTEFIWSSAAPFEQFFP